MVALDSGFQSTRTHEEDVVYKFFQGIDCVLIRPGSLPPLFGVHYFAIARKYLFFSFHTVSMGLSIIVEASVV
jgi:hypothetical protein